MKNWITLGAQLDVQLLVVENFVLLISDSYITRDKQHSERMLHAHTRIHVTPYMDEFYQQWFAGCKQQEKTAHPQLD